MSSERIREDILTNAKIINTLNKRIKDTFPLRNSSPEAMAEWDKACKEFHENFERLCFPGGAENFYRLKEGDPGAVEAALCFAECRPYFFRSGYMLSWILRKLKKAPLSPRQAERFNDVLARREKWKKIKASQSDQ